jgi:uncharacterized protein YcfL
MKKLMILSTVAVAALSLAACKPAAPGNETISNDTTLNTEAPVEGNITDETLNTTVVDNATVAENATAIDTTSNATAK